MKIIIKTIKYLTFLSLLLTAFMIGVSLESEDIPLKVGHNTLYRVNIARQHNSLEPVTPDEKACEFAQVRLEETKLDWSHTDFNNRSSTGNNEIYTKYLIGAEFVGEVLAKGFPETVYKEVGEEITMAWIKSPTHNEIILNPTYDKGCVVGDAGYYVGIFYK